MKRRHFLGTLGAGACVWAREAQDSARPLQVTGVEAIPVKVPANPDGMSIWMFVKLKTNKPGLVGYGEVYMLGVSFRAQIVAKMVEDFAAEVIVGENPYHVEDFFRRAYDKGYNNHPDFIRLGITSAIEMACWDIMGKDLAKPVYELLGGPVRERIRTYSYLRDSDPPLSRASRLLHNAEASARRAKDYVARGFTAIKLDPVQGESKAIDGYDMHYPVQEAMEVLERSERVVGAVREAVGSKCDILIGTHGEFTAAGAIRFARSIERFQPLWFEEPVPPEDMAEMALVARGTSIPICTGERLSTKYEFARLIEHKAAAIFNFDLGRVGGILEARKVAAMAEAHHIQISPHLWGGPLIAAASVQVDVCSTNFLIQESIEQMDGFHAELLRDPMEWREGFIVPSTRPGLGHELNEAVARKHPPDA